MSDKFDANSRYVLTEVAERTLADGTLMRYLRRRFVPDPAAQAPLATHAVEEGERLDRIADRYYGDPIQFWRVADGNLVLDPGALVDETGRRITIPFPLEVRQGG